jgi:hypothetical protein
VASADVDDPDNWSGGFYELAINLGPPDDQRLALALESLWQFARVEGCLARRADGRHASASLALEALDRFGHLRGVVRLADGSKIVCGVVAIREENGDDWLDFYCRSVLPSASTIPASELSRSGRAAVPSLGRGESTSTRG